MHDRQRDVGGAGRENTSSRRTNPSRNHPIAAIWLLYAWTAARFASTDARSAEPSASPTRRRADPREASRNGSSSSPRPAVVVDDVVDEIGVETRLQVSPDGRKLEEVAASGGATLSAAEGPPVARAVEARRAPQPSHKFVVQVGAFAQEANARQLLSQLSQIGQRAYIDGGSLYRVRIGPFDTREQAIQARARLETAGLSAIVVAP